MNIFKILSSNDGSINEPNISSFLAYLLTPNKDHGLSSLLLQEILSEFSNKKNTRFDNLISNDKITDLSEDSGYFIDVDPERRVSIVKNNTEKHRDIDIVIEIIEKKTKKILYSICIENKINDSSINKKDTQLEEEISGLKNWYNELETPPEIYLVYLTLKPSNNSDVIFNKINEERKIHLYWYNHNNSIFNKISKILKMSMDGLIDPVNNHAYYLISSFLVFIKSEFKSYLEEKREKVEKTNYGKPVIDHLNDFTKGFLEKNKIYSINDIKKQFSDYIKKNTGQVLHDATRDADVRVATVNERNRCHYGIKNPDENRKNIFYYPNPDNKNEIKVFDITKNTNVEIWFNNNGNFEKINSSEIQKTGKGKDKL